MLQEVGQGAWNPQRDTRVWIRFCLTAHYQQAMTVLRRVTDMGNIWRALEVHVKEHGLPERTMMALVDAAHGYRVRNGTYRKAAEEISPQVASRDLKRLVDLGFLVASGDGRARHYVASAQVRDIREQHREPKTAEDPFA